MWNRLFRILAVRSAIIFSLVHLGFIASFVGIALAASDFYQETWFRFLALGFSLLTIAYVTFFWTVLSPLIRIALLVRKILYWRKWIQKELPVLLASLPTLIQTVRSLFSKVNPTESETTSISPESLPQAVESVAEVAKTLEAPLAEISKKTKTKKAA